MIKDLWKHLTKRRKKQFSLILILMIFASLTEVVSVGAILPFLGMLTSPDQVYHHELMRPFIKLLQLSDPQQLFLPLTILFIIAALFAGAVRLILLYVITRFSFSTGHDLSVNIYRRTLYQNYEVHISRNSSEVINGIITKTGTVINGVINPILVLISSTVIITAIVFTLFTIDASAAIVATLGFGGLYWIVIRITRHQLDRNSECISEQSTQMIKSLQEGLGGIRDVLIDGTQSFYSDLYRDADLPLRRAAGMNAFIAGSPRFAVEAFGITLIAGLAYSMSLEEGEFLTAIPILGALALGAQRLLPALQSAYGAYSNIKGSYSSFNDVLDLLKQPLPFYANEPLAEEMPFKKQIVLKGLKFRYAEDAPWVLKKISLTILKGSRVGFIGKTGSGKTTLVDIIMGLLPPTDGQIFIDHEELSAQNQRSWQAHIAHVPQDIYLSDSSVQENIAFGIPLELIDQALVKVAAKQAQVSELIESWPDKYNTFVGERGVRLSGGQRQRIGIARALYKKSNILIFDEATSALDNQTELAVMDTLEGLSGDLTVLIIAHRLSTLKGCDQVVKLECGDISISSIKEISLV